MGGLYMSHKNKLSLVAQVQCALEAQLAIGQSKHVDKLNGLCTDCSTQEGRYYTFPWN